MDVVDAVVAKLQDQENALDVDQIEDAYCYKMQAGDEIKRRQEEQTRSAATAAAVAVAAVAEQERVRRREAEAAAAKHERVQ